MIPAFKLASFTKPTDLKPTDCISILVKDASGIPAKILSYEERKFVEKEFNEKRNVVAINQY